jgi:hypothetical protein
MVHVPETVGSPQENSQDEFLCFSTLPPALELGRFRRLWSARISAGWICTGAGDGEAIPLICFCGKPTERVGVSSKTYDIIL